MNSFCTYYNEKKCQSCTLINSPYLDQIAQKEQLLKEAFPHVRLLPSVSSRELNFRNKAKLSVTGTADKPIIGLTGLEELDGGREILNCPLHHQAINAVVDLLPEFIIRAQLRPYQIAERKGELKGVILFYSEHTQELYLRFVLRSKESLDRIKKHMDFLTAKFPYISCISANIQPVPHALLEGKEEIMLSQRTYINHQLDRYTLRISPQAFVQTNQSVAEKLYTAAAEWIRDLQPVKFSELFCGQGAFSFFASSYVKESLGIEINAEAIAEAKRTAQELGLLHLSFKCKDATEVKEELARFSPDVILVNPPRKGLGKGVDLLCEINACHLIYSSCNHESLARDLEILSPYYNIEKIQLFDMFPHTRHFETLVLLTSVKAV
jgi:23S rRNA (uracil747-C5)-methyltransferase